MAAKVYVLSEADRDIIAKMVQEYLTRRIGLPTVPAPVDDYRTHGAFVAYPDDADGISAMDTTGTADPTPGSGTCTLYQLSGAGTPTLVQVGEKETVYNLQDSVIPQSYFPVHKLKTGGWVAGATGVGLVGIFLAEDHPGRGIVFDVYAGTWNSTTHDWDYPDATLKPCIDLRYGVPYPTQGATGEAIWRASDTYGRILVVVDLDCESAGTGTSGLG